MAADDFFSRWSKRKTEAAEAAPAVPPADAAKSADATDGVPALDAAKRPPQPAPTLDDVENLTSQSDYTAFMAKGVDENVRRSAMKKLFADPHFNIMDGLDIYIDDYTKSDPIPPEMMAMLQHSKSLLDPLKHLEAPTMQMTERKSAPEATTPDTEAEPVDQEALAEGAESDILRDPANAEGPEEHASVQDEQAPDTALAPAPEPAADPAVPDNQGAPLGRPDTKT
jgi:hypothetical protein